MAAAALSLAATVGGGSGMYEAAACSVSLQSSQPAAAISTSLSPNLPQQHTHMLRNVTTDTRHHYGTSVDSIVENSSIFSVI